MIAMNTEDYVVIEESGVMPAAEPEAKTKDTKTSEAKNTYWALIFPMNDSPPKGQWPAISTVEKWRSLNEFKRKVVFFLTQRDETRDSILLEKSIHVRYSTTNSGDPLVFWFMPKSNEKLVEWMNHKVLPWARIIY